MNAKEARQFSKLNKFIQDTNKIEKVLRIEIANAVAEGKFNITCYINAVHNERDVITSLRNDGYCVNYDLLSTVIGQQCKYEISW